MSDPVKSKNGKQGYSYNGLDENFSPKNMQMWPPGGAHPDQGVNGTSDSSKTILEEVELEADLSGSGVAEFEGIDTKQNVETSSELEDKAIHPSQATGRPTDTWQEDGKTTTASHLKPGKVTEGKINQPKLDSMEIMLPVKKKENLTNLQQKVEMMRPTTSTANWFGFKLKAAALGICIVLQAYTVLGTEIKQRPVQLGSTVRLPSRTCSVDNIWNFSYQNKSENLICEGMECADDYKMEKDEYDSCHLVFNVTKEKLGIYRNTLYHNDSVSEYYDVHTKSDRTDEKGGSMTNMTQYYDTSTVDYGVHTNGPNSTSTSTVTSTLVVITSIFVPLAIIAIFIIIMAVVCKSYQRKKSTNGNRPGSNEAGVPLNQIVAE